MSFTSRSAKVRLLNLQLRYLIPLILLFFLHASESKAQGAHVWSEQEKLPEYFGFSEEPPYLIAAMNHIDHLFNPQPFLVINDTLQASNQIWSEPVLLFEVADAKTIQEPIVLSDSYGNVHIFWEVLNGNPGESDLIYYMRQDALGWTSPVDIVSADRILGLNAVVAQDEFIYLVWSGAGDILSYSRAPVQGAESVKNWSKPIQLIGASLYASIAPSPSGDIYLAYAERGNAGVYEQVIESNNLDNSLLRLITPNSSLNTSSEYVQMRVSNNGTRHVVWTEFDLPDYWPPRGVFYAHSVDGGDTWSVPKLLAGDGHDQINITVLDDSNIHVAWNGMAGVGGRYHRWSSDGGVTWSETYEVVPAGISGTEGPPEILGDQADVVHMLTTYSGCAWYTYFENQRWANPVCISGAKAQASNFMEQPAMAISEGNKLHAVFWDDRKRLWYTTKVSKASWIPPKLLDQELIQSTPSQIVTELPSVTPTMKSTSLLVDQQIDPQPRMRLNPAQIIMISLLPVVCLVIWIVVAGFFKKTK